MDSELWLPSIKILYQWMLGVGGGGGCEGGGGTTYSSSWPHCHPWWCSTEKRHWSWQEGQEETWLVLPFLQTLLCSAVCCLLLLAVNRFKFLWMYFLSLCPSPSPSHPHFSGPLMLIILKGGTEKGVKPVTQSKYHALVKPSSWMNYAWIVTD